MKRKVIVCISLLVLLLLFSEVYSQTWYPHGGILNITADTAANTVTAQANHFTAFGVITESQVVLAELASFTYSIRSENSIKLQWTTVSETNNLGFEIERSSDRVKFVKIGFVRGYGDSGAVRYYEFIDNDVNSGEYYYRLKQIDSNGSNEYSDVIKILISAPKKFDLSQNYPNPFNPETIIKYQLSEVSDVTIIVVNLSGKEIKTLVNKRQRSGYYSVKWDGTNNIGQKAASGIYLYRLQAGKYVKTNKMIFLK